MIGLRALSLLIEIKALGHRRRNVLVEFRYANLHYADTFESRCGPLPEDWDS